MAVAPIVVQVSPPESPVELRRSLLESCGRAVKTTACVEPTAAGDSGESAIVATVVWSGSEHVRLEVTLRETSQMVEREIDFGPHDALEERWRTTGLVVGTLASVLARNELPSAGELPEAPEAEVGAPPPAPSLEPAPAQPESDARANLLRPPRARHARARTAPRLFVDASAFLAPALIGGPFRSGGDLGGRVRFAAVPVEPALEVAYSESLSDDAGVKIRVVDTFVGFAVTGELGGPFSSVAWGEGFFRWLEASTTPSGRLGPTERARVLGGARLGLDGIVRVVDPFSAFVGAAGIFAAGSTDVSVESRNVGSVPALSYELRAGVMLAL